MLAEEPDVRKALVRFREGLGGNLRGAPSLLDCPPTKSLTPPH